MKKLLTALLAAMLCLTGCGGDKGAEYSTEVFKDFFVKTSGEVTTWNYLNQAATVNARVLVNIVSGLLETDKYGQIVGDLAAEGWTHNDDYSEWTFTLKDGLKWYAITGQDEDGKNIFEEYASVTAADFVAAQKWVLTKENQSVCYEMATSTIKNAKEYFDGKITDFSQVGIEAVDEKTIKYTLKSGMPYFDTVLLYPSFYPANQQFIDECGDKFGTAPEYILYNSAYLIEEYQNDTEKILVKNENYWDAESVTIPTVEWIAIKDIESSKEYFERGELTYCQLAGTQPIAEANDDNPYMYRADPYACSYCLFLNNQYADEDGREALNNLNFRKALAYGFNREEYVAQTADPINPTTLYTDTYTAPGFVATSDGTDYTKLPALAKFEGDEYDSTKARQYMDAAKAELEGKVTWPVSLNWWYKAGNETAANTATVFKDILETEFPDEIVVERKEYSQSATTEVYEPELNAFAAAGWIPDYGDPMNVLYTFLPDGYMNNVTEARMSGWDLPEFISLYNKANAITDDVDARYNAFAEAEAYLLENCYVIPLYQAGAVYKMSAYNEYSRIYALTSGVNYRYKGIELSDHAITAEEMAEYKTAWEAKRKELGLAK